MLGNDIVEGCNAPGQGALTTTGPIAGRVGFVQAFGKGAKCYYAIFDGTQTEKGWTTTADQLTRNVIWTSVNGLSSTPLNFTGACQVYCTLPAQRALWADDASVYQAQNRRITGLNPSTTDLTDAVARIQVGAVRTWSTYYSSGGFLLPIPPLPAGAAAQVLAIEFRQVTCAADTSYFFRLSTDNAASFLSGSSEYRYSVFTAADDACSERGGFASYAPLTSATIDHVSSMSGMLDFDPVTRQWSGRTVGINPASGRYIQNTCAGNSGTNATPTHILIGAVGQNLTGGTARVTQKVF